MQDRIRRFTSIGFIISIAFWLGIFLYYAFVKSRGNENYLILKILLFFEPLFCSLGLWGYLRRRRSVYILTLLFFAANGVLSLTDQVGFWDIVSLLLSAGVFVLLAVQRRDFTGKGK